MKVGRTSLVLVPVALLARGVAFLVPAAWALWFGVDRVTDAFYWALSFPTFVLVLASTSLGTAALPTLARTREEAPARLPRLVGGLVGWAAVGSTAFGTTVALLSPYALPRLTEFDAETQALTTRFLWALIPFMTLSSMGSALRVTCEVHGRFLGVAFTPLLRASIVIGSAWALLAPLGAFALPAGLVAGELAQMAWWLALLARSGVRVRPGLWLDPAVRRVARDLAPILGGEALVALNLVVDKGFAAWLPAGSVATLEYADRARVIPQTLLESTLVMVAFATWSNLRAQGRLAEARAQMDEALRWTLALAAPVLAGMFIGRVALVSLMFERGAFVAADTAATAQVLGWYIPGILPNMLGILAVRAHVVERNLRLILGLGVLSLVANAALNAALVGPMGLSGLALATTLNSALIPGLYLLALRDGIQPRGWGPALLIAAASVLVAVAVERGPGPPKSVLDPVLWVAAVPCFALLAAAWRATRGRR